MVGEEILKLFSYNPSVYEHWEEQVCKLSARLSQYLLVKRHLKDSNGLNYLTHLPWGG